MEQKLEKELLRSVVKGTHNRKRIAVPGQMVTRFIREKEFLGEIMDTTTTTTTTTTTLNRYIDPRSQLIRTQESIVRQKYTFPISIKIREGFGETK